MTIPISVAIQDHQPALQRVPKNLLINGSGMYMRPLSWQNHRETILILVALLGCDLNTIDNLQLT